MFLGTPLMIGLLSCAAVVPVATLYLAARERGIGGSRATVFVASWAVLVMLPLVVVVFMPLPFLGAYDFAGAIPFHLGAGVAAIVVGFRAPRRRETVLDAMPVPRLLGLVFLVWLAWLTWLVLMELDVNQFSSRIALSVAVITAVSVLTALVVERLRSGRLSRGGAIVGLLSGLAASTASCAYLEPIGATVTGVAAGALAMLVFTGRRTRGDTSLATIIAVTNLGGGIVGLVMIGLFDSGRGFLYTGAPTLPVGQLAGVFGALAWSTVLCMVAGLAALRKARASERT